MTTNSKLHLNSVPDAEQQPLHPAPFVSDAERDGLSIINQQDKGAPVLDVDAVLRGTLRDEGKDKR